ncbi:MAG: hypoxanthine phosphoribosyltransferase [Clostridiaceae bacterium]|nr:hypoxanthine phosphoribosyltransferase [Eubacteriales bacterium]
MRITTEQNDIDYVLYSEERIRERIKEIAATLTEEYRDKNPVVVCILKGASFFYVDLCRLLRFPIFMDFISVSSYGASAQSSGVVRIVKDMDKNITDRHVLIVEDIIDSGLTLKYLKELFTSRRPASIKTVCFLDKHECHQCEVAADYCGFSIPNRFVVGYGLDYSDFYRNLPYIGVLKPEVYA